MLNKSKMLSRKGKNILIKQLESSGNKIMVNVLRIVRIHGKN